MLLGCFFPICLLEASGIQLEGPPPAISGEARQVAKWPRPRGTLHLAPRFGSRPRPPHAQALETGVPQVCISRAVTSERSTPSVAGRQELPSLVTAPGPIPERPLSSSAIAHPTRPTWTKQTLKGQELRDGGQQGG